MVFSWSHDAVFHRDNWWIQAVIRTQKISDIIEFLCLSDELIFTRHVDALLTPRRDPSIFKLPIYVIGFKIIKNTNMIVFRILCQLFSVVSAVPAGPCQNTGRFEENKLLRSRDQDTDQTGTCDTWRLLDCIRHGRGQTHFRSIMSVKWNNQIPGFCFARNVTHYFSFGEKIWCLVFEFGVGSRTRFQ